MGPLGINSQGLEGTFWYHGRTDDMLKVSGVYVAPTEIENCLLQCSPVQECAVIGHDEGDGLIKPKAFIVLREGEEPSESLSTEIKEFVKARLALYKYPRWIEFVSSLPKNDRGKINRKELKARDRTDLGAGKNISIVIFIGKRNRQVAKKRKDASRKTTFELCASNLFEMIAGHR